VKILTPTQLLAEAADVLAPVRDEVVVIGAAALEAALAQPAETGITATRDVDIVAITPTRDVDVVVPTDRAAAIIAHLEHAEMHRSEVDHERAFTWVRGDLKVQLVRTFHPFPKPPADGLPVNPVFSMAAKRRHQETVAFAEDPEQPRLHCGNVACLLALKQAAFGRTRPPDGTPVERDYHDAYLLIFSVPEDVAATMTTAEYDVTSRATNAIAQLASGGDATVAAARQLVALGGARTQRVGEATVRRAALSMERRLAAHA
jgi:hypothetical protein